MPGLTMSVPRRNTSARRPQRRRGIIELTPEFLLSVLHAPAGTQLFDVMMDHEKERIRILVGVHEDLPIVPEACPAPVVELQVVSRFV